MFLAPTLESWLKRLAGDAPVVAFPARGEAFGLKISSILEDVSITEVVRALQYNAIQASAQMGSAQGLARIIVRIDDVRAALQIEQPSTRAALKLVKNISWLAVRLGCSQTAAKALVAQRLIRPCSARQTLKRREWNRFYEETVVAFENQYVSIRELESRLGELRRQIIRRVADLGYGARAEAPDYLPRQRAEFQFGLMIGPVAPSAVNFRARQMKLELAPAPA